MQHVKEQNWFAVGLDVIVVIVGIFLGIQVTNWYQDSADRQAEKVYLVRLHDDIQFTVDEVTRIVERRIRSFNESVELVFMLQNRDRESLDVISGCAIPGPAVIEVLLPKISSVEELLSTGQSDLLTSTDIRTAAIELIQRGELLERFQDIGTGMNDIIMQYPEFAQITPYIDEKNEFRITVSCDFKKIDNWPEFMNALIINGDKTDAFINRYLIPWYEQLNQLHNIIDKELGIVH